jgi:sugar phosphate isomerase/epimerase
MIERSEFAVTGSGVIVPAVPEGGIRYGVSTYSYTGDVNTNMTLEDVFAEIADLGATGIEILGEGNLPSYPSPPAAFIDTWHGLVQQYGLTPTNFGSWVDTTRFTGRDLTAEEGAAQLQLDLRLAKELGFTSVRPKFGVVSWDLDPHPIWEEVVERSLDLAAELDVVICPEIHSPTPIKHPVTQGYLDFIARTGTDHFKLLIDTGIFQTETVRENAEGLGTDDEDDVPPPLRPLRVPMSDLAEVLPHTHFIQAKFFEIDDSLHDLHVPWAGIVDTLETAGWSGWLSSEYEGRREPYRGRDQVRRQHALLRSLQHDRASAARA